VANSLGPLEARFRTEIIERFKPSHLELVNESHLHARGQPESHFRLVLVSDLFSSMSRIERARAVEQIAAPLRQSGLHALSQFLWTPQEWSSKQAQINTNSPKCSGNRKEG
jgi:BolA protein